MCHEGRYFCKVSWWYNSLQWGSKGNPWKQTKHLSYDNISLQDYMSRQDFSLKEKKLSFALRSSCYKAKIHFKKLNQENLQCSINSLNEETQSHIFQSCQPILQKFGLKEVPNISQIYGTHLEQKQAIEIFVKINETQKQLIIQSSNDPCWH